MTFFTGLPMSLRRGVGKRILGYFLLAGVVPTVFTAGLAYYEVGRGLQHDVYESLRRTAKDYGLDVMGRLQRASTATEQIASVVEQDRIASIPASRFLYQNVKAAWILDDAGVSVMLHGAPSDIFDLADPIPDTARPNLTLKMTDSGGEFVLRQRLQGGRYDGSTLIVQPNPEWIWGSQEDRPYATDVCIFTTDGHSVYCSSKMISGLHSELDGAQFRGDKMPARWQSGNGMQLAAMWQLFLAAEFGAPPLDVVMSQPETFALRARGDLQRVYLPALALVIVLTVLLALKLIGRSLVPLESLTSAARQIAGGNLLSRVRIRSKDEFETLGSAFNHMADRISRQISTLEAMSGIDRLILSGADFEVVSERVVEQLMKLTDCEAAAVIARDNDAPHFAKMISSQGDGFVHERMSLPQELGNHWCQPRQLQLDRIEEEEAPYKPRFAGYGIVFAMLIPVVLEDDLKGILLLGSTAQMNLSEDKLKRCVDLAGRFAVALASVEREEALYRQAHFDELTGLPNRQLLKDRLEQLIAQARKEEYSGALLFLDLDRFKEINDVYGHSVGDLVLVQAAERILSEVQDTETVARLGGDEFVVVLPHVSEDARVRSLATRLLDRLAEPFLVRGDHHFVSASIGIVMLPDDGSSVEILLKNADAAMYRAKEAGRGRFEFFSKRLNAESRRKIRLERDLRSAHHDRELKLYYQPQFTAATGDLCGAEALLRWEHASEGPISPAEFIPLAEDSALIVEIGRWVVERACMDFSQLMEKGLHPGIVSINVSTRQLRDARFVSDILESLHRFGVCPAHFQLEVTESAVAQNRDIAIELLQQLRDEGVCVAIDDFGTGYSSLSYLQQMPFDAIKIDKTFVDGIGIGDASDNICRTIIKMAAELGKKSIAEGVETQAQLDFLVQNRCDYVQGFIYSRALSYDSFVHFVEAQDFQTRRRKTLGLV